MPVQAPGAAECQLRLPLFEEYLPGKVPIVFAGPLRVVLLQQQPLWPLTGLLLDNVAGPYGAAGALLLLRVALPGLLLLRLVAQEELCGQDALLAVLLAPSVGPLPRRVVVAGDVLLPVPVGPFVAHPLPQWLLAVGRVLLHAWLLGPLMARVVPLLVAESVF